MSVTFTIGDEDVLKNYSKEQLEYLFKIFLINVKYKGENTDDYLEFTEVEEDNLTQEEKSELEAFIKNNFVFSKNCI
jgi:hypothetical protein